MMNNIAGPNITRNKNVARPSRLPTSKIIAFRFVVPLSVQFYHLGKRGS